MNEQIAQKILQGNLATYNAIADKFSDTRSRPWPLMLELVKKYVKNDDFVLDMGCGNGRLFEVIEDGEGKRYLDIKIFRYLGIDTSEKLIRIAKKKFENERIKFQVDDILNLDLGEEKFDVVFMLAVLNHLPSKELRLLALENIKKVLKPGGMLIMTNWNLWRFLPRQKTFWNFNIKRAGGPKGLMTNFIVDSQKYPLYYRAFTLWELKRLAKKSDFKIVESYYDYKGRKSWCGKGENLVTVWQK